jgi:hypothetical protein
MEERYREGKTEVLGEKEMSEWLFIYHRYHVEWPGIKPVSLVQKTATNRLNFDTA